MGDGAGTMMADLPAVTLGSRAVAVSAGSRHSCALLEQGNVKCWGCGADGQLGQGDDTSNIGDGTQTLMADVPFISLAAPATAISAGGYHTCALLEPGNLHCWGQGSSGQLGLDSDIILYQPSANSISLGELVIAVSAGGVHTCGLLESGKVKCWGHGDNGRLGYDPVSEGFSDNDVGKAP